MVSIGSADNVSSGINKSGVKGAGEIHNEGAGDFDKILEEQIESTIIPDNLKEAKENISKGKPMYRAEVAKVSASFYKFGMEYIKEGGKETVSYKAAYTSITAMFGLVENYGSEDALNGLSDFWQTVDETSNVFTLLREQFGSFMGKDTLPFKGLKNSMSNLLNTGEKLIESTNTLKKNLRELAIKMEDPSKREKLLEIINKYLEEAEEEKQEIKEEKIEYEKLEMERMKAEEALKAEIMAEQNTA
ncbi:MAG: hypothetical protein GY730_03680 [bacterium]|nr:hypothetical protein [bacterium]